MDVLIECARFVFACIADTPDQPELLSATLNCLCKISILDPDRINIQVAIFRYRRHKDGQRNACYEQVQVYLVMGNDFVGFAREVTHIEGAKHTLRGIDGGDVDTKVRKDAVSNPVSRAHSQHIIDLKIRLEGHETDKLMDI